MRILVAPDKFAGTLSAVEAANAIAAGWGRVAPQDELDLAPMSDGGPGFVDVLHSSLGGELVSVTVRGPLGEELPAAILVCGDTAYVEAAHACGLDLTAPEDRKPEIATSYGVGELLQAAIESGASNVVLGLGGTGTIDGGAGMLAALGAEADVPLDRGPLGLTGISRLALPAVEVSIVAAADVTNPLYGLLGAAKNYGVQKGLSDERIPVIDGLLEAFAGVADKRKALAQGAGAAGGLGFGLLLLGAERQSGLDVVAVTAGLAERAMAADLVLTGEGSFDFSSRSGKVPVGVAQYAAAAARPCVVLAGQVQMGNREMRAAGIEEAYSMSDLVGEAQSFADPVGSLTALAERAARAWSR